MRRKGAISMILNFPAISAAGAVLPEGSFLSGGTEYPLLPGAVEGVYSLLTGTDSSGKLRWELALLSSGSLTLSRAPKRLDAFLLGGGGGGGFGAGAVGHGGYGCSAYGLSLLRGLAYPLIIGAGGSGGENGRGGDGGESYALGLTAPGGEGGEKLSAARNGSDPGSGGGGGKQIGGLNGWRGGDGCPGILILRSAQ